MKKKTLVIVAACVGLWAAGSWMAPALKKHDDNLPDAFNDHVLHERIKTFPTARSAPKSGEGEGLFVLPDWVPQDATDVKVKVQTDGNAKLIRFTLASAPLKPSGTDCPEGAFGDGPTLEASWWPQNVGDDAGRPECSEMYQFRVAAKGDQVYAWSNGDMTHA
ncbi:hypothetical protein [Streptomyces sp. H27-D2]|uniref:hypothetical protein n=1 Tax=Streptomyces sp. H27-D2 TaxID=3046304 RepID=UPI002DB9C738|nr:hypothetical protein [Streptomyces sp. H27-D2]MEC4015380.1 hypothetical protein [Streptomyces sp. H27-D2]